MQDLDVVDGDGHQLRLSLTSFGVRLVRPGRLRTETLFECPIEDLACLGDGSFELSGHLLSSDDADLHSVFEEAVLNEQARQAFRSAKWTRSTNQQAFRSTSEFHYQTMDLDGSTQW